MNEQEKLIEQRTIGHAEGQRNTITDVNAGLIDDLIAKRLQEERLYAYERCAVEIRRRLGTLDGGVAKWCRAQT